MLASFELEDEIVLAAAEAARAAGCTLVVSPAPARPLPAGLADAHPILVPNENEALALAGADAAGGAERGGDAEAAARRLNALTGAPVVVTLGARGALVVDGDDARLLPAPRVRAVDTTGAGDVFTGVLACGLAGGDDIHAAAARAVEAAARSVTVAGAR